MIAKPISIRAGIRFCRRMPAAILPVIFIFPALTAQAAPPWRGLPPMPFVGSPQFPAPGLPGSAGTGLTQLGLEGTIRVFKSPEVQGHHPAQSPEDNTERRPPPTEDFVTQGQRYFHEGRFQAAVDEFKKAGDGSGARDGLTAAYSAMAMAAKQDGRIKDALDAADALREVNRKTGTLLRGDILLQINALPLAVETYQAYADDENVQRVLAALRKNGLDRFQRLETGNDEWTVFQVQYRGADVERPVRYLFRKINGREIPAPFAHVSERPAPRGWSWALVWWTFSNWQWPETNNLMEYRLTVNGANASDIVEFWEGWPGNDKILAAAKIGYVAADALQHAEKQSHDGQMKEAFFDLRTATGADWSISNPHRHYGALVSLARVARAVDPKEADHFSHILKYRYPYWGQLAWAGLLAESDQLTQARAVLEKTADDWPLRHEALEQLADMQWNALQTAPDESRMEMGRELQRMLAGILSRRPGLASARLRLAEWHVKLRAYALAADILKDIDRNAPDGEAGTMLAALKALGRDAFEDAGQFTNVRGLTFRVYQSLSGPSARGTIIHHAAEVVVLDSDGHHLETFALSSQALSNQGRREYFLDRITASGLQTLVRYKNNPVPSALDLGRALAAQ